MTFPLVAEQVNAERADIATDCGTTSAGRRGWKCYSADKKDVPAGIMDQQAPALGFGGC